MYIYLFIPYRLPDGMQKLCQNNVSLWRPLEESICCIPLDLKKQYVFSRAYPHKQNRQKNMT